MLEKTFAVNLCANMQNKASASAADADQSEVRQFRRAGLRERQVRDEKCNRL